MRLVTFTVNGAESIGVLDGDTVVDLSQAALDLPADMNGFIEAGDAALAQAAEAAANAGGDAKHPVGGVKLLSPIPVPRRDVMAVGRNYHEHAREFHDSGFDATAGATAVPDHPIIFTKATTSVSGPGDPILTELDPTGSVDYEGELAVIIGKEGRGISREDAFGYVYGYTVCNDLTARNLQHRHKQWFIGKSPDGYCPLGPAIVTADEAGHPDDFRLTTRVNGEKRQDSSCGALIFDIPALIECISAGITLKPGDIIATGTPVGVGIGFDPPIFLKPGDVVSVTIEPLGTLENPVR